MKEESKKQRLKELESGLSQSSSSFDSTEDDELIDGESSEPTTSKINGQTNGQTNGHLNGQTNGYANGYANKTDFLPKKQLTNGNLANGNPSNQSALNGSRKSTRKYGRTRTERSSKEFFDALLSNRKVAVPFPIKLVE